MIFNPLKRLTHSWMAFSAILFSLVYTSCTKIEKTTMGGDLIPAVDNIFTFDTTLTVITNNYVPDDSTRLNAGTEHVVGGISNDPLFGTTRAKMFFELKPPNFPFLFTDSVKVFDSAVLVLQYAGYYGDSSDAVQYNLYESKDQIAFDINVNPAYTLQPGLKTNTAVLWGQKTMRANQYKDTVYIRRGENTVSKVTNQLRIRLDDVMAAKLFYADTNKVYKNDSLFQLELPGFVLEAQGNPNALHYFSLTGGSKIQFYFQSKNGTLKDTTSRDFVFNANCGHAVELNWDSSGSEITNFLVQNPSTGVPQVYLKGTPGSMVWVDIPDLKNLSNRVLHRVDLRVTELTENSGATSQLTAPPALYLDGEYENEKGNFRGIPYDMNPASRYYCYPADGIDFSYFGGTRKYVDIDGKAHAQYTFNITRFTQGVITRKEPYLRLRLSSPHYMFYKDCINSFSSYPAQIFPFTSGTTLLNQVGEYRLRAAGGNHTDKRLKMELRVIYSKM